MWDRPTALLDLELATAPTVAPIALNDAKAHLRLELDDDDEDAEIQLLINAAVSELDGHTGRLGRCLVQQQWTYYLDRFPWRRGRGHGDRMRPARDWREIPIPLPPLISVDSVTYLDTNGAMQTLATSVYSVMTGKRSSIVLNPNQDWPDTEEDQARAVTITFKAGYATGAEPDPTTVPASIRAALLLLVGDLYENREGQLITDSRATLIDNPAVDRLLTPFRIFEI